MPPKKGRPKREVNPVVNELKEEYKQEYGSDVCRVCLGSETEDGASLFAAHGDGQLYQYVAAVASVRITQGDDLPARVCAPCLADLRTALAFKEKAESSDRILHDPNKEEHLDTDNDFLHTDYELDYEFPVITKTESDHDGEKDSIDKHFDLLPNKNEKVNERREVECHDCGDKFRTKCKLRVHWKKQHLPFAYICEHCKRVFKSAKVYQKHKKNQMCVKTLVNMTVEGFGKGRIFSCTKCDYKSKSSRTFMFHCTVHTKVKRYKCEICNSAFTQISSLHNHKESRHNMYRKEFTCEFCGILLKGRSKIKSHLMRHSTLKKYQCDMCKKCFKRKTNLIQHLLRHREKSFHCEICSKSFYTLGEINNHKNLVHLKIKNNKKKLQDWHTCVACGFRTQNKYKIYRHIKKHTSNNYACNICGYFFQKEVLYKNHMERHEIGRVLPCPYCDLTYSTKSSVGKHIKKKHEGSTQPITICKVVMSSKT